VTKFSGKQFRTQRTAHHYTLFIHSFVCLTTGPQHLPKRVLHWVRPSPSSYNFKDPLFSLTSPSSCLHLIPRLAVTTIIPSVCPLIACVRRQLLGKTWPIQLDFLLFIVCMIFQPFLTLCSTSSHRTWSLQPIFSILLQNGISKLTRQFINLSSHKN
jgi:hypothetical protein